MQTISLETNESKQTDVERGKIVWSGLVTCQQFQEFISAVEIRKHFKKFASYSKLFAYSRGKNEIRKIMQILEIM